MSSYSCSLVCLHSLLQMHLCFYLELPQPLALFLQHHARMVLDTWQLKEEGKKKKTSEGFIFIDSKARRALCDLLYNTGHRTYKNMLYKLFWVSSLREQVF